MGQREWLPTHDGAARSGACVLRRVFHAPAGDDFSTSRAGIVPLDQRRPMWHFMGLWTTFVAGFSFMVPGFVMYDGGFSLAAAAGASLLGYGIYVAYALIGSYLGAQSGQTLTLLTRAVFGRAGSWLVSLLVMIPALGWVGFQAGVLTQLWYGFYGWGQLEVVTIVMAAMMIFNNLFGFTGISVFARYLVTPVLVIWCGYLVVKGFAVGAGGHRAVTGPHAGHVEYWVAVAAVIGFAMWGNEADVWRYGRPRFWWPLPSYLFACFWFLLFTVAGWMMASLAGGGNRFTFTVRFSLFGAFWLAFLIATISQFAINDGNYYEAVNAAQNLFGGWHRWRRSHTCLLLAGCGALAAWIVNYKILNAWYVVPVFLAITAPCATMIMAVDRFVLPRALGMSRPVAQVPSWQQAAVANWPAIAALLAATAYGTTASAILPAHLGFSTPRNWGPVPLEAWLLAGACYLALAAAAKRKTASPSHALGFPRGECARPAGTGSIRRV
jgi:cytosine permease